MRATSLVFRRELSAYLRSPVGYIVAALLLFVDGILFQTFAIGAKERYSADVLRDFFLYTGMVSIVAGLVLSIRLIAEERAQNTIILLNTSPIRDVEVIAGKFLAALVFLAGMILASLYMPLLIMVNGKITISQLIVGYAGLLLLGAAALAIGTFASSLAKQQLVALATAATITGILVLVFPLASRMDSPGLKLVLQQLDMWWVHFQQGPMQGVLKLSDVVYYLGLIYFFLLLATKTLGAKRWQ
jgi:ABC-2 type transport system permease protein